MPQVTSHLNCQPSTLERMQVTILLASSSVPLWIRALGMITPLHKQFGPLFYVINLMMLEVNGTF